MSTLPPPPPHADPAPLRSPASTFVEKAAVIAAPGTITFALLYYFGSLYNKAYYSALGVPVEDLELSIQGIVANSTNAVFLPLCALLAGGLILLLTVGWLGRRLSRPENAARRRSAITWLLTVGVVMMLLGLPVYFSNLVGLFPAGWPRRFLPALMVAAGSTLAVFGVHLRLSAGTGVRLRQASPSDRTWLGVGTLLLGLLTLSLFYDMALYVTGLGRGDAQLHAMGGYRGTPWVVVHAYVPLRHHARSIEFTDYGGESAPYRYEYRGFRLLAKSPTRFYLVSYDSRWLDRSVVVLPDDGVAWLEIRGA
ncbi:hypothetical protein ABZ354_13915 [Streptomyces sp. NPDC005925]|uniref:hypothetical protein n=1 Tax=Streptomyces sp. NPDC005925 TaxID=3157172 RepID=UPI0033E05A77